MDWKNKRKTNKTTQLVEKEIRFVAAKGGGRGMGDWMKVVDRYRHPVPRQVSTRGIMYSAGDSSHHCSMRHSKVAKKVNPKTSHHEENNFSFFSFFSYLYERTYISWNYCDRFTICGNHTIMLSALTLYSNGCQLYLNKTGGRVRINWHSVKYIHQ